MMFSRAFRVAATQCVRKQAPMAVRAMQQGRVSLASGRVTMASRQASTLVSMLEREIEEEKGNCFEGEELAQVQKEIQKYFSIKESPGSMEVFLTRKHKDEDIKISFDAQNTVELEDDWEGDEELEGDQEQQNVEAPGQAAAAEEGDDDDEDFDDALPGIRFIAEIKKENKGLQFECVASENLAVERVRYLNNFEQEKESSELYAGPNFIDLELDVQEEFYKYLEERHIDDNLAQFITEYSDLKEQREYLTFLQNAVKFVK